MPPQDPPLSSQDQTGQEDSTESQYTAEYTAEMKGRADKRNQRIIASMRSRMPTMFARYIEICYQGLLKRLGYEMPGKGRLAKTKSRKRLALGLELSQKVSDAGGK